jgi:hypothetical protein
MNRTIVLNDVEPAAIALRHPLGINLDLRVKMQKQNGAAADPALAQFVLMPRSKGGVYPYDMGVYDQVNGIVDVHVPGTSLTDVSGYNIEIYSRKANTVPGDPPLPTGLIARGVLVTVGSAYKSEGPLNLINVPVVIGPTGPQGEKGTRGSMWFTGNGDPTLGGVMEGDMYLDETTGNVWRYSGTTWVKGVF